MAKNHNKAILKIILFSIAFFLCAVNLSFGYTETFYVCHGGDGSQPETDACATAYDAADFSTVGNWDTDDQDDGKIGPNDIVYFKDDGGDIRGEQLNIKQSGLSGLPITIDEYPGDTVVVNASTLLSGWNHEVVIWTASDQTGDTVPSIASGGTPNCRNIIEAAHITASATSARFKILGADTGATDLEGTSFGLRDGATFDFDGAPDRVQWDTDQDDTEAGVLEEKWSDWETITIDSTKDHLWHMYDSDNTINFQHYAQSGYNAHKTGGDYTLTQALAQNGTNQWIGLIAIEASETLAANVWQVTSLGAAPSQVFFDGVRGNGVATLNDVDSEYDWFYGAGVLYVYSTSDPDIAYTSPGIESSRTTGQFAFYADEKDYITIKNIRITKPDIYGIYSANSGSNWIIDGVEVDNSGEHGIIFSGQNGDDAVNITIQNCSIHDNTHRGISGSGYIVGMVIKENTLYNNSTSDTTDDADDSTHAAIYFGTLGMEDILVEKNYLYDNGDIASVNSLGGSAIWYDGDSGGVDDSFQSSGSPSIIRYNYMESNKSGIHIENASYVQAYYNIVANSMDDDTRDWFGVGIQVDRECHYNLIYNNILYTNRINIRLRGDSPAENDNMTYNEVKNNILLDGIDREFSAALGAENDGTYGSNNVYTHNCLGLESANFVEWADSTYKSTYDLWEAAYGGTTYSVEKDPAMTDPASGDFTLTAQSPCIDSGANLGATYDDAIKPGSTWPDGVVTDDQDYDGRWDIGAYRYLKYGGE